MEELNDQYIPPPSTGWDGSILAHVEQQDPEFIYSRHQMPEGLTPEEQVLVLHYRGAIFTHIQYITGLNRWEIKDILDNNMAKMREEIDESPAAVKSQLLRYYFQMMDTATAQCKEQITPQMMRAVVSVGREIALITGVREPIKHTHQVNQISVNMDGSRPAPIGVLHDPTMRALQLAMENRRIEIESGENGKDDILLNS